MGKPKASDPAKLFMSLIAREDTALHGAVDELRSLFGEVDFVSEKLAFDFTRYYAEEMGSPLFRRFITFERLIDRAALPDIKLVTNGLEEKRGGPAGNRRVNVDPGYVCLEHVILATTKGYSHRPYLRDGIYGDLTLIFRNKSFQPLEWTYPDYRQPEVIGLFNQFRKRYLEDLRGRSVDPC